MIEFTGVTMREAGSISAPCDNPGEQRFRAMLDALPAAIYTTDAQGRVTHYNRACVEFSGREPELGSDHWCVTWKLFYPDGRPMPHDECPMAIALKEGRIIRGAEAIAERPDGSRVWFTPFPTTVRDEAGTIIGGINMLVDITDRKKAEQDSARLAEQLRHVTDAAPALISYLDADLCYRFNNKAYEDWFHRSQQELTGRPIRDVVGAVAFERLRPRLEAALAGKHVQFEDEIPYQGAGLRAIHADYVPDRTADGQVVGIFVLVADITERHRAEEARSRLAAIVESSDDAIISKDLRGTITSWNASAQRLYGYTAEEAIGQPVTMLIPPDRAEEEPRILERISRGERIEHYETVRLRKDGELLNVALTVSPITDAHGRIIGASKIARDITERTRQEATLRLMTRELSHRVKNTLATVKAIAQQTQRHAASMSAFTSAFNGRIDALAAGHSILTQTSWQGASIRAVIEATLSVYPQWTDGTISLDADDVILSDRQTLAISMVVHELATNALKHGALSTPGGTVAITIRRQSNSPGNESAADLDKADTIELTWREHGGPAVQPPARRGFGTTLIERICNYELGGTATLTFPPSGATCVLSFPHGRLASPGADADDDDNEDDDGGRAIDAQQGDRDGDSGPDAAAADERASVMIE